jgi:hypothetical protein
VRIGVQSNRRVVGKNQWDSAGGGADVAAGAAFARPGTDAFRQAKASCSRFLFYRVIQTYV